jgi:hypothetical protein
MSSMKDTKAPSPEEFEAGLSVCGDPQLRTGEASVLGASCSVGAPAVWMIGSAASTVSYHLAPFGFSIQYELALETMDL